MEEPSHAEQPPPGEALKAELDARGWTQSDLAEILGKSDRFVSDIVNGRQGVTAATAIDLASVFGPEPQYWLALEAAEQLRRSRRPDGAVSKRAKLYSLAPIKDMIRRNWISGSRSLEELEAQVLKFFEIDTLEDQPRFQAHAARKSTPYQTITNAQLAWLFRAKQLAKGIDAESFSGRRFSQVLENLSLLWKAPEEARHVPRVLSEAGIRLLTVEALPGTKIDGATFWLDDSSPVVVLSMRFDRIDYFWHTVLHELAHVKYRDGLSVDADLWVGGDAFSNRPESEALADKFAVEQLVPKKEMDDFILRVGPLYSKMRIQGFAHRMNVHPGIVLGQLQYRGELSYSRNRALLVRVRDTVAESALTDGFGNMLPASPY